MYLSRLKKQNLCTVLLALLFFVPHIVAAAPSVLTYQGRILKTDGTPLQYNSVSFTFQITDPNGACVIYQEQVTGYDMTNSNGIFDVPIGKGSVTFPTSGSLSVLDAFNNSTSFACKGSATPYNPAVDDTRKLRVQFYDGVGWQTISPDTVIRSVPFAGYSLSAQKLGSNVANDFVLKSDINNAGSGSLSCSGGNFLTWDATTMKFGCAAGSTTNGTVTNVTATAPLSVATGTSTPALSITKATSTTDGYLAAADWSLFNSKQNALGFTPLNPANNLSELTATASTARTNLGLGSSAVKNVPSSGDAAATEVVMGNDSRLTNSRPPNGSAGGDLTGTYPNPTLSSVVTAGTGIKISYDAKGRVISSTGLLATDIPNLDWSKITSGKPTTLSGYGITDGVLNAGNVPSVQSGSDATRVAIASPAANSVFITTDTKIIYQYISGAWVAVASNAGTGGTITSLTGDVTASGSGAVAATVNSIGGSSAANVHSAELAANAATSANTASTIIKRDASGSFIASAATLTSASVAQTGGLIFKDSGANSVTVQAPASVGTSYVLKWPANAAASAGQVLSSDTLGNLSWVTPAVTTGNITGVLPIANGGTNSSTALNGNRIMVSSGGAIVESAALANGQVLIGSTGAAPVASTLTAGTGISITNGAGSITVATTGLLANSLADGKIWVGQSGTPTQVTPSGDISMTNAGVVTVGGVKGKTVSAAPTTNGQVLRYDGTNWTPNFVSMLDLRSNVTGSVALAASCGANQTLTFNSAMDNLTCSNIAIADSQITYASQAAKTFFAAPTGAAGAPTFRAIAATDLPSGTLSGAGTIGYLPYYSGTTSTLANSPVFTTGGNVGIGTTSPAYSLEITSPGFTNYVPLALYNSGTAGGLQHSVDLLFDQYDSNALARSTYGKIRVQKNSAGSSSGFMSFYTTTGGTNSERMRIDSAGNVGIGTASPSSPLTVSSATSSAPAIAIQTYNNNATQSWVQHQRARGTAASPSPTLLGDLLGAFSSAGYNSSGWNVGSAGIQVVATENSTNTAQGTRLELFSTKNGTTTPVTALTVDNTGYVGIGTSAPSEMLEVSGNVKAASYLYTSDARLKKDIITLPNALAKALQLRGVNFVWKSNDEKTVGFIAQEVEKIYPELVHTDSKTGFKSVQYGNIVAVLVEALKEEHQERVKAQRGIASVQDDSQQRLEKLEKENQELKARLDRLEKLINEK